MIKTLFFLAALALAQAVPQLDDEDSCEYLDNGCPADFDIHKLLPHEYSCWRYYSCSNGDRILMRCPRGTSFDPEEEVCVSGSAGRDCINDDRSETVEDVPPEEEDIELLPNGCPVNYTISQYLPHERYCNMYYQCNFGGKLPMVCAPGTHFNPAVQACDHISIVGCTLPGGNYVPTTTPAPAPTPAPEIDFLPNGCPRNGSIDWLVPHQTNCSLFYACFWGGLIQMECPGNLHFSPSLQRCESPATAGCAANPCTNPCGGNCGGSDPPCPDDDGPSTTPLPDDDDLPPGGDPECGPGETCPPPIDQCPGGPNCPPTDQCPGGPNCPPTDQCPGGPNCPPTDQCPGGPNCPPTDQCPGGPNCPPTDQCPGGPNCPPTDQCPGGPNCPPTDQCPGGPNCPPTDQCPGGPNCPPTDQCPGGPNCPPTDQCPGGPNCPPTDQCPGGENCPPTDQCPGGENCPPTDQCPGGENCPPVDDCPVDEDPNKRCEEDCNSDPWAHDHCDKYWICSGNQAVLIVCSEGLHFNPSTKTCDFACNAGCVRENIEGTSSPDGLKLYLPWNKIDANVKELLKLIAE